MRITYVTKMFLGEFTTFEREHKFLQANAQILRSAKLLFDNIFASKSNVSLGNFVQNKAKDLQMNAKLLGGGGAKLLREHIFASESFLGNVKKCKSI